MDAGSDSGDGSGRGDGGRGGDVVALAVGGLNTLIDFRYRQHIKAENGRPGLGKDMNGAAGQPAVIELPVGTQTSMARSGAPSCRAAKA